MENRNIIYYEEIDSTNIEAQRLAAKGAAHGTVVLADKQTAGKGRRGRTWESPSGENVYLTVILRPVLAVSKAPMLTIVMAYSAAKVLREIGFPDVQIKWPNDLVLSGKKVCGILTEMQLVGDEIDHIVIGVGINANTKMFPEELTDKATSLYLESGKHICRDELVSRILDTFWDVYLQFLEAGDLSFLQKEYNEMLVNCDKEVLVLEPGNAYTAYAVGMNHIGELTVRTAEGEEKTIFAGEVSVRGIYGYV